MLLHTSANSYSTQMAHLCYVMLCYVIIKGDPSAMGWCQWGTQQYKDMYNKDRTTQNMHSKTKTDKTNGHNTYTQRNDKEHVTTFTHKQTCTYSLVDAIKRGINL